MLFSNIGIIDEQFAYRPHQWVGTEGTRIAYVGSEPPAPADAARFGEVYDGTDRLLMPAFYNAHAHAPMTLLRGYSENLPLQRWLTESVWPFEEKMTAEDNYWGTLLACAEMARYGCVGFSDMYFHTRERARAVIESGLKANLCETEIFAEEKPLRECAIYGTYEELIPELHGAADGRIRLDYNIHAEYTSFPQQCADMAQVAREHGLRIHLHASETRTEHEECKQRHDGLTPLQYFDRMGVLDAGCIAAHCVWAEPADIELLAEKGTFVAANPASNMKLGSGFAPIPAMLAAGVHVCLGTDGVASNNNHDMLQDLYLLALIYKGAACDPTAVTPAEALRAATREGALAQGRDDCGLVKEGFRADLTVLDVSGPSWFPATNPACNLVFAGHGSDVVLTMSDGQVIYRDGMYPTVDVERAKAEVSARTQRIIGEL